MDNQIESSEHQMQLPPHQNADEDVLKFMDSLDSYLSLINSLSSTLRQGWFDFASARHSMGASRVNSVLLDLKEHPAATHLEVDVGEDPHFTLCKWTAVNVEHPKQPNNEDSESKHTLNQLYQRHKDTSEPTEAQMDKSPIDGPLVTVEDQMQKDRIKSLAVFGTLVSPKLRAAQLSFETALEKLVEIANVRASMLSSLDKVQEHVDEVKI